MCRKEVPVGCFRIHDSILVGYIRSFSNLSLWTITWEGILAYKFAFFNYQCVRTDLHASCIMQATCMRRCSNQTLIYAKPAFWGSPTFSLNLTLWVDRRIKNHQPCSWWFITNLPSSQNSSNMNLSRSGTDLEPNVPFRGLISPEFDLSDTPVNGSRNWKLNF